MAVILNALGRPEPSPEVTRRLLAIDRGLFLRHLPHLATQWAVCWSWPQNDRRWASVRDGSVDPAKAFDIVGYLPMDCGVDEAPAYLERMLRSFPKDEVSALADRVASFNAQQALDPHIEAAIADVLDNPDPTGKSKTRRGTKVKVEKVV